MSVVDNTLQHRFEIATEGDLAYLSYEREAQRLWLLHTFVPEKLGHRGIGGQLVEAALEAAVADGLSIVPKCPFVREWLGKHPQAAEKVRIDPISKP